MQIIGILLDIDYNYFNRNFCNYFDMWLRVGDMKSDKRSCLKDYKIGYTLVELMIVIAIAARQGEAKPRSSSPQKGCLSAPLRDCA